MCSFQLKIKQGSKKKLWLPGRFVFLQWGSPSVVESQTGVLEAEIQQGVAMERSQIEGFNLTHPINPTIEAGRLGVREEIGNVLERQYRGVPLAEVVLRERVNERLRLLTKQRLKEEAQEGMWITRKLGSLRNVFNKFRHPIDYMRGGHELLERMREDFGERIDIGLGNITIRHLNKDVNVIIGTITGRLLNSVLNRLAQPELDQIAASLGQPVGLGANEVRNLLGLANAQQLETINNLTSVVNGRQLFPDNNRAFQNLLNLRRIEAEESKKMLNIDSYDPVRLGRFVESMRVMQPDIYNLLTKRILLENALNPGRIATDHKIQALLAQLVFVYERSGNNHDVIKNQLEQILNELPESKIKLAAEAEKQSENESNIAKISEAQKSLSDTVNKLLASYQKADMQATRVTELSRDINNILNPPTGAPPVNPRTSQALLPTMQQELSALRIQQNETVVLVNELEGVHKNNANNLVDFLLKINKITAPPTGSALETFSVGAKCALSQPAEILRSAGTPSAFEIAIFGLNLENLNKEINKDYKKVAQGKQRISAHYLLILLKDLELKGSVSDPNRRREIAVFSSNLAISDAGTVDIYRHGNTKAAESMLRGFRGMARKGWQWIASKSSSSEIFTARDIIENITGMDKAFDMFKELDPECSLNDLRHHIKDHGEISTEKLAEFCAYLSDTLKDFKVNKKKHVKLKDTDWGKVETMAHHLRLLHVEISTREFLEKIGKKPDDTSPEDHMINLMKETDASDAALREKLEKSIAGTDWKASFDKMLMRTKYLAKMVEAEKHCKKEKLKGAAKTEYLISQGIPVAAIKLLKKDVSKKLAEEHKNSKKKAREDAKREKKEKKAKKSSKPKTKFTESKLWRYSPLRPLAWGVGKIWGWAYGPSTSAPSHKPSTAKESKGGH